MKYPFFGMMIKEIWALHNGMALRFARKTRDSYLIILTIQSNAIFEITKNLFFIREWLNNFLKIIESYILNLGIAASFHRYTCLKILRKEFKITKMIIFMQNFKLIALRFILNLRSYLQEKINFPRHYEV